MSANTIIHICSKYRSSGSFDNFVVDFPKVQCFNTIKLLDLSVAQTQYVFSSSNNSITFMEGATTYTATITPGNYSATELVTVLPGFFTAGGGLLIYTCTYSSITGKLTISASGPFSLRFLTTLNQAYNEIGFEQLNYGPSTSLVSTYPVNLSPPSYLYLHLEGLGIPSVICSTLQTTSGSIPILTSGILYTFTSWSSSSDFDIQLLSTLSGVSSLKVSLRKQDGSLAGIQSDWAFTLALSDNEKKSNCKCIKR